MKRNKNIGSEINRIKENKKSERSNKIKDDEGKKIWTKLGSSKSGRICIRKMKSLVEE